jgi:reverse gyrase
LPQQPCTLTLHLLLHPRTWGEGGAHEAIRPTKPIDASKLARLVMEGELELPRPLTRKHYKLYDLIFKRFIASQMKKAIVPKQKVRFIINGITHEEERFYGPPKFSGFLEMYNVIQFHRKLLSGVYQISSVDVRKIRTVPLYTQGDVVKLMKEKGIGRPSTYATILNKLLQRRYVIERGRQGKLIPTRLGIEVYKYLTSKYGAMVSEERTRLLEDKMDRISTGEENYISVLDELYKEVKANIQ